jgi:hypothetical protein
VFVHLVVEIIKEKLDHKSFQFSNANSVVHPIYRTIWYAAKPKTNKADLWKSILKNKSPDKIHAKQQFQPQ